MTDFVIDSTDAPTLQALAQLMSLQGQAAQALGGVSKTSPMGAFAIEAGLQFGYFYPYFLYGLGANNGGIQRNGSFQSCAWIGGTPLNFNSVDVSKNIIRYVGSWSGSGRSIVTTSGTLATNASPLAANYSVFYLAHQPAAWIDGYVRKLALWNVALPAAVLQRNTILTTRMH
jgi:hypothetical protein